MYLICLVLIDQKQQYLDRMSKQVRPSFLHNNRSSQETDQQNILQQALKLIEQLYKMRLIDRIARPRQKITKQIQINEFANKLNQLHQIMSKIRSQITEANLSDGLYNRNKSIFGSATNKTVLDWKKYIRLIETRYNEVFIEGSFKHCKKICDLLALKYVPNLQLIIVQNWALQCLQNKKHQDCC